MRKAFSLVELLTVVAITSVLVAALLPAVSKAREQATRTMCAGNLRGVGVQLASYATDWNTFPTPHGQPSFDASLVDWNSAPDHWGGWAGTNTWTENYMFGTYAWWVGALTQDTAWYTNKAFQCTGGGNIPAKAWYSGWQCRDQGWMPGSPVLSSNIRGVTTYDPDPARALSSAWYVYMHPFTYNVYGFDWWDAGYAGSDIMSLLYGPSLTQPGAYKLGQSALGIPIIAGPRYNQFLRRPQVTCPEFDIFDSSTFFRWMYEPHDAKRVTGTQNSRGNPDPEAKNYLWTDGSVVYVFRP